MIKNALKTQIKTSLIVAMMTFSCYSMESWGPFSNENPAAGSGEVYALVNRNDPVALYKLGMDFHDGNGVEQNFFNALQYWTLSANLGYCYAQLQLGFIHYDRHNYLDAYTFFQNACYERGTDEETRIFDDAMIMMGIMHENGQGVHQNNNKAGKCYYLVAKKGHEGALQNLTLLADDGNDQAQFYLAEIYSHGHSFSVVDGEAVWHGVDYSNALKYYTLASVQNNANAQSALSILYFKGKGVDPNFAMGISLLHKSLRIDPRQADALKNLLTLVPDELDIASQNTTSDATPFEIDGDLYVQLQKCDVLHSFGKTMFGLEGLEINELSKPYGEVLDFFGDSDRCIDAIKNNLNMPEFGISCLQPTEKFLKEYQERTKEEKTGCCMLNMDDKYYFFIGDRNPWHGYLIKETLGVKKGKVMAAIATLEFILTEKISELKGLGNSITNSEQTAQFVNELALVAQANDCVQKYIASIQEMLKANLHERNKLFIEEYPFYKDM